MSKIHLVKLVIETASPMAINSGEQETAFDSQLARDASGLPYIPATAIAGVWGHLIQDEYGLEIRDKWLGTTSQSASLVITNGVLHNSLNQPVAALTHPNIIKKDVILQQLVLASPMHRERVSINDRGVAKQTGKFDQILLPKGLRFSLSFKWADQSRADKQTLTEQEWSQLLSLWQDRRFAFGASTRNGLGQFKIVACEQHQFDLQTGAEAGIQLQATLENKTVRKLNIPPYKAQQTVLLAEMPLQAVDNWRCGQGTALLGEHTHDGSVAIMTYSEAQVEWRNEQASFSANKAILCGSSIKGILAHRIAFHLRKHKSIWAETMADATHKQWQTAPEEIEDLFGLAADTEKESKAGLLYVDDINIDFDKTVIRHHNRIDRFTGGVQKGALFTEELLYQPRFSVRLWIRAGTVVTPELKAAVSDTLADLKNGLLPFGASSGRGNSLVMADPHKAWSVNLDAIQTQLQNTVENVA